MKEEEFYIGYYPNAPKNIAKVIKIAVGVIFSIIFLTIFVITRSENGFANSQFEYGTLTELEGILYQKPVPMLRVFTGKDASGKNLYKSVLLVNLNKFGAENLLMEYTRKGISEGESLVKLRGTLIYHDGVTVMELTEQENALLGFSKTICGENKTSKTEIFDEEKPAFEVKKADSPCDLRTLKTYGEVAFDGEIIDPKCFFGAMKPGFGKPHRDCAIRCIAGGIPPVFVVKNPNGEVNYMLITDENGQAINQIILKFVAIPMKLQGNLEKIDEWFVLRVKTNVNKKPR